MLDTLLFRIIIAPQVHANTQTPQLLHRPNSMKAGSSRSILTIALVLQASRAIQG